MAQVGQSIYSWLTGLYRMPMHMDGGDSADSYSDFEIQHITGQAQKLNGTGGSEWDYITEPLDQNGIDNDEVAELVYYKRTLSMYVRQDGTVGSNDGSAKGEFGFGINLPNADAHLLNLTGDGVTLDPNEVNADQGDFLVNSVDDPGILDSETVAVTRDKANTTDGVGAGAEYSEPTIWELNMRDAFGRGPFLDRSDDLSLFVEINNYGIDNARVDIAVDIKLVWDVHEVDGGRASLAPPGADAF